MDKKQLAKEFGEFVASVRDGKSIRRVASGAGLTVAEMRRVEAGEVFPNADLAYSIFDSFFGRDWDVRDAMLFLEAAWLLPEGYAGVDLHGWLQGSLYHNTECHGTSINHEVKELGIEDAAVRKRIVMFASGGPGVWGRMVDGVYTPDEEGNPRMDVVAEPAERVAA